MDKNAVGILDKIYDYESIYKKQNKTFVSLNHITEVYYYEYYINRGEYQCINENINQLYCELAEGYKKQEEPDKAEEAYRKALLWNPVDLDAIFGLCEIFKQEEKLEEMLQYTKEAYHYCVTRATLARFYRNFGFYFLEKYKPNLAAALYQYSNLFFPTEQADAEIAYLEKAMNGKFEEKLPEELMGILNQNSIPVQADSVSLGLVYMAGKKEEESGRMETAKECYTILYDLTQDDQIGKKLSY